jgi:hypothetical protein
MLPVPTFYLLSHHIPCDGNIASYSVSFTCNKVIVKCCGYDVEEINAKQWRKCVKVTMKHALGHYIFQWHLLNINHKKFVKVIATQVSASIYHL